jgi:L-threonylcarbamoyladenylate synthase
VKGPRTLGIDALVAHLEKGGAALLPTDTLPALAARPVHAGQIWARKRRPAEKPLILMGGDLSQLVTTLGVPWRAEWLAQARNCWPGAVTLVLPIEGAITEALHPGGRSLGLRVPSCSRIRDLLLRSGPLATTSVNRSGEPAAVTADEAAARFSDLPLLAPLPWPVPSGVASTVIAWRSGGGWEILRRGAVAPPTEAGEA